VAFDAFSQISTHAKSDFGGGDNLPLNPSGTRKSLMSLG
jgi:hypothetical protein